MNVAMSLTPRNNHRIYHMGKVGCFRVLASQVLQEEGKSRNDIGEVLNQCRVYKANFARDASFGNRRR